MSAIATGEMETPSGPETPATAPSGERGSRRKTLLLLVLLLLLAVMTSLSIWYVAFRKPISELPLPGVASDTPLPTYSYDFYGPAQPAGIAVSRDGSRVYVAQAEGTQTVMVFDAKGNLIKEMAPPNSQGGARTPTYLAVNPGNGDVYVADRYWGGVAIFDQDGNFKQWFTPDQSITKWIPLGVAFDAKGNLYIGDVIQSGPQANTVLQFDASTGKLLQTFGVGAGMSYPNGIAVDAAGRVAVADGSGGRLLVFDASGKVLSIVSRGVADGQLGMPRGVTFDDHGQLLVADTSAQEVYLYQIDPATGALSYTGLIGSAGHTDATFAFPTGIAADQHGRVYVADTQNNRIQVWGY